jgi:hypothetical protein
MKLMSVRSVLHLLVTANVPCSVILSTLKVEATNSSETPRLTVLTRHHIPKDGILQSLKRYILKNTVS